MAKGKTNAVVICFLGPARDWVGTPRLELIWEAPSTLGELRKRLSNLLPSQSARLSQAAFCIGEEVASDSSLVQPGDEVIVLPPICGGSDSPSSAYLTFDPIDVGGLLREALDPAAGGVASFVGVVRAEGPRQVRAIWYEAFTPLAAKQLKRIAADLLSSHLLRRILIVHRLGEVQAGEAAVVLIASAKHRLPALDAVKSAIERIKKEVPIWKKECYVDGTQAWVEGEPLQANPRGATCRCRSKETKTN